MAGKLIQIKVVKTSDNSKDPWVLTIQDNMEIRSYLTRGKRLLFNYRDVVYEAFGLTEDDFLRLVPHLDKRLIHKNNGTGNN
jgi:hypothetical protein